MICSMHNTLMDTYLTVKQAADILGVTKQTITHHIRTGRIRHFPDGRRFLIFAGELDNIRNLKPGRKAETKKKTKKAIDK